MHNNMVGIKAAAVAAFVVVRTWLGWRGPLLMAWVLAMALDYLSGTIAAGKNGEWSSKVARDGLSHKGGMIFAVIVAALADWIMVQVVQYTNVGLSWPAVILPLVLAWYIVTELGSILENAVKMGAVVPGWLIRLMKATAHTMEAAGEQAVTPAALPDESETE